MADGGRWADFEGRGFRDFRSELLAEFRRIVCEECGLVAGAGDGNVAEAGVEQVQVDAGVGVDQNPFGG